MDFAVAISTVALEEFDYVAQTVAPSTEGGVGSLPEASTLRQALRYLGSEGPSPEVAHAYIEAIATLGPTQRKTFAKWWRRESEGLVVAARKGAFLGPALAASTVTLRRVITADEAKGTLSVPVLGITLSDGKTTAVSMSHEALQHMIAEFSALLGE